MCWLMRCKMHCAPRLVQARRASVAWRGLPMCPIQACQPIKALTPVNSAQVATIFIATPRKRSPIATPPSHIAGVVGGCAGALAPIRGCHRGCVQTTVLTPSGGRVKSAAPASAQAKRHGRPPRSPKSSRDQRRVSSSALAAPAHQLYARHAQRQPGRARSKARDDVAREMHTQEHAAGADREGEH